MFALKADQTAHGSGKQKSPRRITSHQSAVMATITITATG